MQVCVSRSSAIDLGCAWRVAAETLSRGRPKEVLIGDELIEPGLRQKLGDADVCFAESQRVLAGARAEMERARTLRSWARHRASRQPAEGNAYWAEAREIFERLEAKEELGRMEPGLVL